MKKIVLFVFILLFFLSNKIVAQFLNIPDSLIRNELIDVELKQDSNNIIHLFVSNNMKDTVVLKSKFTLDKPTISCILMYKCFIGQDSVETCDFEELIHVEKPLTPVVRTFSNGFIKIPPNKKIILEFFREKYYDKIYFKIQWLVKYKDWWFVVRKKTNKI